MTQRTTFEELPNGAEFFTSFRNGNPCYGFILRKIAGNKCVVTAGKHQGEDYPPMPHPWIVHETKREVSPWESL